MNICLINPFFLHQIYYTNSQYHKNSHLGLGYIASVLIEDGHYVTVLDAPSMNLSFEDLVHNIKANDYEIIGITVCFENYMSTLRLMKKIKEINNNIFIFIGGYLPTLSSDQLLDHFIYFDCIVLGEGEITVKKLVKGLKDKSWENTAGIIYKINNTIFRNNYPEYVMDLDCLPNPLRIDNNEKKVFILSSRGCRGNCIFCSMNHFRRITKCNIIRRRTPINVVKEILAILKDNRKVEFFAFADCDFSIKFQKDKDWLLEFIRLIKEYNIKTKFYCEFRVDDIIENSYLLEQFKKIGLMFVFVGIENFLQRHLDFYNKKTSLEMNIKAIAILDKLKIPYHIGYILFNPIISIDELIKTTEIFKNINFNNKNKFIMEPISPSIAIAYPGTKLHDYIKNNNLLVGSVKHYKFHDHKTQLCYEYIKRWESIIMPLYTNSIDYYYFYLHKAKNKIKIENAYFEIFQLDLKILYQLSNEIKNDEDNLSILEEIINDGINKLNDISKQIENYNRRELVDPLRG